MNKNRVSRTHTLRIATRQSPLALWQAHYVRERLMTFWPSAHIELVPMITRGDKLLDTPLSKIGGKGLFVKELEWALLEERADIAVHSIKDVPMALPPGLGLITFCERDDPRDAFVSPHYTSLDTLPLGSVIGTSSSRRQCQLKAKRPDLIIHDLRGNVGTRLAKLDRGDYDAIILAVSGLKRLGLTEYIRYAIPPEQLLPAVGQGAIGIECRLDHELALTLLAPLNDPNTAFQITAERAMNAYLKGGCQVPIGGYAQLEGDQLWLRALVGSPDGSKIIYAQRHGLTTQAEQLGISVAKELLAQGANEILSAISPAARTS